MTSHWRGCDMGAVIERDGREYCACCGVWLTCERKWTTVETAAADEAIGHLRRSITRIEDLLTEEERDSLHADLAEMARIRRRAMNAAADLPMS